MGLLINLALLLIGFVLLIKGADIFVDGASDTARKFRVPKMLIGLTIVSFGTSAPEFAVSIQSILSGKGDILLGNVVGSNILNILLILGLASLVGTLRVNTATVKKEIPVLVLITLAFAALLSDKIFGLAENIFTRQDGIVLLLFFCIFIYYLIGMARKKDISEDEEKSEKPVKLVKALLMIVVGLVGIVLGSDFVVKGASEIAATFGVSQRIISLTIVALGTSLPELVTSVIATKKGEYDIAIGNIVGSNIFNIGIVAGLPVAIFGGVGGGAFSYIDIIALIVSAVTLFFFARHGGRIGYKKGIIFLLMFLVYYGYVMMESFA
jgi:K+-dependent Na+/Ca+ exchanger family protein